MLGENRKLLIFPLAEVPEMARGKGVRLQRYKDGGVADARVFARADGLTWQDSSGRSHNRSLSELKKWVGDRAQAGRLPPQGFPRHGKFGTLLTAG
jgi:topoisomerase-4 subunit A